MKYSRFLALTVCAAWHRTTRVGALVILLTGVAMAQTSTTYSSTDGKTPSGMQGGAPAGSYALSGFDNISPFSGGLSFRLPLLSIGGRGGAGYTMTLPIEKKWRVEHTIDDPNLYCQHCETYEVTHTYSPTDEPWGITPGYGAGVLQGRHAGKEPTACGTLQVYTETLTRLTFTAPDGTEFELRDQLNGGKPFSNSCGTNPSRGTIFVTADGTSATFISDAVIQDRSLVSDYPPFYPSGYLLMRDGTRYRINTGHVEWIQDRQGNRVSIGGVGNQTLITDALGREVTVSYANLPSVPYDEISFAGVGGTPRHIRVHYASLSSRLRAGYSINTYSGLFSALGGSIYSNYDPQVVSSVELPDGRTYNFSYNSYGELARVELPTGGAFEYDFQTSDGVIDLGGQSNDTFGLVNEYEIYRRVERKRVYGSGGALESRTEFSLADGSSSTSTVALVKSHSASGNLLAAEKHYYYGSAYPYLALYTKPTHYTAWGEGKEYKTEALGADGVTVLRRSEQTWQQRATVSWWNTGYGPEPANDPRVTQSVSTLVDSSQVVKQTFAYDGFNNQTDVWEYDYGSGAPPAHPTRHTHTDYLTTNPANSIDYTAQTGAHIRGLARAQQVHSVNTSTGVETLVAQSETRYDEAAYPLLTYGAVTGWTDPGTSPRGLATTTSSWLDTPSSWIETHAQYDQLGNVRKVWDAKGNLSQVEYASTYHYAYPTHTISAVPDLSNMRATNTSLESWTAYDFSTGKVTSTTDANNQITYPRYTNDSNVADPLDRVRRIEHPDGGVTKYNYFDTAGDLYVQTISYMGAGQTNPVESRQYFDGLGRPTRAFLYDGTASTPWSVSDTYYDALGRVSKVSNPYRVAAPGAAVPATCAACTTSVYDALGRVSTVTTPDNAQVMTAYSGNTVTVKDQAGKRRKSVTDALGRLTTVYEDPNVTGYTGLNYQTTYSYDVLGNLRKVDQGGQLRYFMYDSLSRLIRAKNPEQGDFTADTDFPALADATSGTSNNQWSTGYTYDAAGNLSKRKDARNITTTYQYDNINRLKQTGYSDSTPYTLRTYDFAANGRGRHYASYETSASGTKNTTTAYDVMGRPTAGKTEFYLNSTALPAYTTSRTYDKLGHVIQQSYPSGHTVNYSQFDVAGRLKNFTGNLGDGATRTYSTGIEYDAASRMTLEGFGTQTALNHKRGYNVRGQMCEVGLGTPNTTDRGLLLFYYSQVNGYTGCGSGTDNNGNMVLSQHWVPNAPPTGGMQWFNQFYAYDSLNRISSVQEQQNGATNTGVQAYDYDRWGNRQINAAATTNNNPALPFNEKQFTRSTTTNRLSVPAGQAGVMNYDEAGNLTDDQYTGSGARTYDAENRMTSAVVGINNSSASYAYDADGRRVRRQTPSEQVWQVYGMDGELLAEYAASAAPASPQKEYGYRNGELLITATAPVPTNVALSSAGATATASSTTGDQEFPGMQFHPSSAIDGNRSGNNYPNNGFWRDDTAGYPDWLQVEFGGGAAKLIDEIDLYFVQDSIGNNPGEPTAATTFSVQGVTDFAVQYWDGTTWAAVTGGMVTGNDKVWRKFTFTPLSTSKVRVSITGAQLTRSRVVEMEAWTATTPPPTRPNLAAAANGATASASTTLAPYVASNVTDGDRPGVNTAVWLDNTYAAFPDWVAVDFGATKSVGEIDVYTRQDDVNNLVEPTATQTFSLYGVTAYDVQYWTGTAWATVPQGSVTNNNLVWRKFSFTPVTTSKIRVVVNAGADNVYSRLVEVEAYGAEQQGGQGEVNWLVTDHLGTPRMVADLSGSLAGIKRHDYLPFGEEVGAGVGGRTTNQGYSQLDGNRKKWATYERDDETGLDFAQARYYSSTMGRFTSPDEFNGGPVELFTAAASANPTFYAELADPQSLNKYQYGYNNPLRYNDPNGHQTQGQKTLTERLVDGARETVKALGQRLTDLINPEAAEPEKRDALNPIGTDGGRIVEEHLRETGKGMEVVNQIIETADPTGQVGTMRAALRGDAKGTALGAVGMLLGPFGSARSAAAKEAVNVVSQAGTHAALEVAGREVIPTRQVAEKLVALAGGVIQRIEKAHKGVGHPYPHINYITAAGEKATIRIKSVGRQFYRTVRKFED